MMEPLSKVHFNESGKPVLVLDMDEFHRIHGWSVKEPARFWEEQAELYLDWMKKWDSVLDYDFEEGRFEWFSGAILNASSNCIDRHLQKGKTRPAIVFQGKAGKGPRTITYSDLFTRVNIAAAALRKRGVTRGDRVVIYLPWSPELPIAMLACSRIGAVHVVVSPGFSRNSLYSRIEDCGAVMLISSPGLFSGEEIPSGQPVSDAAGGIGSSLRHILWIGEDTRTGSMPFPGGESWEKVIHDPDLPTFVPPEPMGAEDPLFIVYTGAAEAPKGIVHTHAGWLLYAAVSTRLVFNLKDEDTVWYMGDYGIITGHALGIYGPLLNGNTLFISENDPFDMDPDEVRSILETNRIEVLISIPSILRSMKKKLSPGQRYNVPFLRIIATGCEPLDPCTWNWIRDTFGPDGKPVIDIYIQAEAGGPIIATLPSTTPIKPGLCGFPFFGIDLVILDDTGEEARFPNQEGVLCIRKPWPGMARTIFGNHDRFLETGFIQIPDMYFSADGAFRDEDGYVKITGRADDTINVLGHGIGALEIESAIMKHPEVNEAAVVSCPHPVKSQGIYAFISVSPNTQTSQDLKGELIRQVQRETGDFVTLDAIQWTDTLPRTPSGKIFRHILENIAAGAVDNLENSTAIIDSDLVEKLVRERIVLNR